MVPVDSREAQACNAPFVAVLNHTIVTIRVDLAFLTDSACLTDFIAESDVYLLADEGFFATRPATGIVGIDGCKTDTFETSLAPVAEHAIAAIRVALTFITDVASPGGLVTESDVQLRANAVKGSGGLAARRPGRAAAERISGYARRIGDDINAACAAVLLAVAPNAIVAVCIRPALAGKATR